MNPLLVQLKMQESLFGGASWCLLWRETGLSRWEEMGGVWEGHLSCLGVVLEWRDGVFGAWDGVLSGLEGVLSGADITFGGLDKGLSGLDKVLSVSKKASAGLTIPCPWRTRLSPGRKRFCPGRTKAGPSRTKAIASRTKVSPGRTSPFPARRGSFLQRKSPFPVLAGTSPGRWELCHRRTELPPMRRQFYSFFPGCDGPGRDPLTPVAIQKQTPAPCTS